MKHLIKLSFLFILLFGMNNAEAQDKNNPWSVYLATNAVDFYPTGSNILTPDGVISSRNFGEDLFFKTDNWNYLPALSSIGVSRYIGSGFTFELSSSVNKIDRLGETSTDNLSWVNLDGTMQYNFKQVIKGNDWFDPFIGLGAGYFWFNDQNSGTFNTNLGVNFWIKDNIAITVDTNYKSAFETESYDFFQHRMGVKIAFGGKDTDGDGVYDKYDQCPQEPGLKEFDGCPDTDSDGIADKDDNCPDEAGLAEFNGCPDSDGDGIIDSEDQCPNEVGSSDLNGCPDQDDDGIADKDDNCPNEAGPAENSGCPWPDTDGDGVLDKDDQCPNVVGTADYLGCEKITEEDQSKINGHAKNVNFKVGNPLFTDGSKEALDEIVKIINKNTIDEFTIVGHADSTGSAESNIELSENRSISVKDYLTANGVDASRLMTKGVGEEEPVASNNSKSGRAQNRRVEINLGN